MQDLLLCPSAYSSTPDSPTTFIARWIVVVVVVVVAVVVVVVVV